MNSEENYDHVETDREGTKRYFLRNKLHRLDGPAEEFVNGHVIYCRHGQLHRLGGPAVEYSDGAKFWYQNGKLHRPDGPSVEYPDGYFIYFFFRAESRCSRNHR